MAIHCNEPNKIGAETEAIFNVTNGSGKNLINSFSTTIETLKMNWKGSDAQANLKDLVNVYREVTELIKYLQKLIVDVNNNEVLPLQKHIVLSGGTCTIGNELATTLNGIESEISLPAESVESWTSQEIVNIAESFNDFPKTFENFVSELNEAKDTLLSNWLDGSNRQDVVSAFNNFNNNVGEYKSQITRVRDNLNIVSQNKQQLF